MGGELHPGCTQLDPESLMGDLRRAGQYPGAEK